jgi:hypothetical protein
MREMPSGWGEAEEPKVIPAGQVRLHSLLMLLTKGFTQGDCDALSWNRRTVDAVETAIQGRTVAPIVHPLVEGAIATEQ